MVEADVNNCRKGNLIIDEISVATKMCIVLSEEDLISQGVTKKWGEGQD